MVFAQASDLTKCVIWKESFGGGFIVGRDYQIVSGQRPVA